MGSDQFSSQLPPPRPEEDEDLPPSAPRERGTPPEEERTLAVLCHVGGFLTSFVVPLILWLVKKDTSRFVAEHAREALNLQIYLILVYLVETVLSCAGLGIGLALNAPPEAAIAGGVAFVLLFTLPIVYEIVVVVLACMAAWGGRPYRSPFMLRLVG